MSADEKQTTAKYIKVDVRPNTEAAVREIRRKHEHIYSVELDEI